MISADSRSDADPRRAATTGSDAGRRRTATTSPDAGLRGAPPAISDAGDGERLAQEPIPPILVLPDPPESRRPTPRLLWTLIAVSLVLLAGGALFFAGRQDRETVRRAAAGQLEASSQADPEFGAPGAGAALASESSEDREATAAAMGPFPQAIPAAGSEPAEAPRQGAAGGTIRAAPDDLSLARRELAEQVRGFDRRLAAYEQKAADCAELADAYRALDRAFVRFSMMLAQAELAPSEADDRLFEIVDQESAAFDRSGCPRPS